MKIFNDFIDIIKEVYILCIEYKKTLLKSALSLFIARALTVIVFITAFTIISFMSLELIPESSIYEENSSSELLLTFFLFLLIILTLIFLILPINKAILYYGSISIYEKKEFSTKEMFCCIKENYLELLWGGALISIIILVILPILYIIGLIVLIPLAVLTFGIGAIILMVFVKSTYSYWALFCIKDKSGPFHALEKNINLGFNKLAIISIFSLLLGTISTVSVAILGVFAFVVAILIHLFSEIIIGTAVLKTIEKE